MITVSIGFKVSHKRRKDFMNSARLILGPTKIQPGYVSSRLYQDLDEPDAILLVEEWGSRMALDHHFNSDQYRIILSLIEASNQFLYIKINTVSKTEGLEAIEAVRGGNKRVKKGRGKMLKGKSGKIFPFNESGNYHICVLGSLDKSWSEKLSGWRITEECIKEQEPTTSLVGQIRDQAELTGILNTLYEQHSTLLSVEKLKDEK